MDEEKLKKLYHNADMGTLYKAFLKTKTYEQEAEELENKSSSMRRNIVQEMQRRLAKVDEVSDTLGIKQLETMSKQFSLCAASSVRVKRAIRLYGMYIPSSNNPTMDLYVSTKYGIKEHKRCSRYSPFRHTFDHEPMKMEGDILYVSNRYTSKIDRLDFEVMRNIPQLDFEKVEELIELTHDTVNLYNSWSNFYNDVELSSRAQMLESIKEIEGTSYISDTDKFEDLMLNFNNLLDFKKTFVRETKAQAERWEPVVSKWQEVNKNYLVLSELANTDVNI